MRLSVVFLGFTTLLLSASAAANFALFARAKQYYQEANAIRLDPIGIVYYSPEDTVPRSNVARPRVVFFGDSRAQAWAAPAVENYEFINRGVGSQTSTQVLQRFSAHVAPLVPDIVILQVGINDLKTIGLFPNRADAIAINYQSNMASLVSLAQETADVVILSTILPAGKISLPRRPFWSDDIDAAVMVANQYLDTLASDYPNVILFDSFAVVVGEDERMDSRYQLDELHMTKAGYDTLNKALLPYLQAAASQL